MSPSSHLFPLWPLSPLEAPSDKLKWEVLNGKVSMDEEAVYGIVEIQQILF